jgi:hypothetical protein
MSSGPIPLLLLVAVLGGGCIGNTPVQGEPLQADEVRDHQLLHRVPAVSGPKDVTNRYLPAIRVTAREKLARERDRIAPIGQMSPSAQCSGALIAPRLVLTAGHCVCMIRSFTAPAPKERQSAPPRRKAIISKDAALENETIAAIIDGAECAKTAEIKTVVYDAPESGQEGSRVREYRGAVRAHPRFELLFNDQGFQVWSNADLAVIMLERPVEDFPVFKLSASEVHAGEPIILVGYGPGNTLDLYEDRHFGENKVTWLRTLETGSVEFVAAAQQQPDGSPAAHLFEGDSGGACVSKADQAILVGIAAAKARNRKGETLSVFTSVYSHRDWLAQQLKDL